MSEVKNAVYFNIPKPLTSVKKGDLVMIVDFKDGIFYLKTKECIEKGKEINAHIKELDKTGKQDELIFCSNLMADCSLFLYEKINTKDIFLQNIS